MPTLMSVKQRNVKIWIRKRLISTCDLYYNDQPAGAKGLIELFCLLSVIAVVNFSHFLLQPLGAILAKLGTERP